MAKEFKGKKISFAIAQKSDYSRELQEFGLAESNEDVVVGIRGRGGAKYRMEEKFRSDLLLNRLVCVIEFVL